MTQLSTLIGQDAVAIATATKCGTVQGVAVRDGRIVAVGLGDRAIPASAVRSFEGDVMTFDDTPGSAVAIGTHDVRGATTLDLTGDSIGVIADLTIADDGTIEAVALDGGATIPGYRLRVVGSYAAILAEELPPPAPA